MLNSLSFNALPGGLSYLSAAVALGLLFASPNLQAQDPCTAVGNNVIKNCGFENSTSTISPWSFSISPTGSMIGSLVTTPPGNGSLAFQIFTTSQTIVGTGTLSQNVAVVQGGLYDFSFYYSFTSTTMPPQQASVSILIGSNVLFSTALTANSSLTLLTFQNINLAGVGSYTVEVNFTGQSGSNGNGLLLVDSFVLAQQVAVPEPATMIMLGSLCSAVAGYKWKRKQRA